MEENPTAPDVVKDNNTTVGTKNDGSLSTLYEDPKADQERKDPSQIPEESPER